MTISKIDPTLTIEKLVSMSENQFFDRKSARIASKDLAHQLAKSHLKIKKRSWENCGLLVLWILSNYILICVSF